METKSSQEKEQKKSEKKEQKTSEEVKKEQDSHHDTPKSDESGVHSKKKKKEKTKKRKKRKNTKVEPRMAVGQMWLISERFKDTEGKLLIPNIDYEIIVLDPLVICLQDSHGIRYSVARKNFKKIYKQLKTFFKVNDTGDRTYLGLDYQTLYCGQLIDEVDEDGSESSFRCGPVDGAQCDSCARIQTNDEGSIMWLGEDMYHFYCGNYYGKSLLNETGDCTGEEDKQCRSCRYRQHNEAFRFRGNPNYCEPLDVTNPFAVADRMGSNLLDYTFVDEETNPTMSIDEETTSTYEYESNHTVSMEKQDNLEDYDNSDVGSFSDDDNASKKKSKDESDSSVTPKLQSEDDDENTEVTESNLFPSNLSDVLADNLMESISL
jgi:hypothetical protein